MAKELVCTDKFDNIITELRKKFSLVVDWKKTFQDLIILRSDLSCEKEASDFLKTYSDITRSSWIVYAKLTNPNRVLLHKYWVCQHSKKRKGRTSKRNIDCPSSVDIVVKKVNRFTKRNDPFLKMSPPLCAVIRIIYPNHNHNVDSTWFLQMLRVSTETKKQFFSYFNNGMLPKEAKHVHESRIMQKENSAELLKNCAINPSVRQIYYLRKIWYSQQFEKLTDSGEIVSDIMKCYIKTDKYSKVKDLLMYKSPLLKERTAEVFDFTPESLSSKDGDSQSSAKLEHAKPKNNDEPPLKISSNNDGCVCKAKTSPIVVYISAPKSNSKLCDDEDSSESLSTGGDDGQKIVKNKCKLDISPSKPILLFQNADEVLQEAKSIPGESSCRKSSCLPVVVCTKEEVNEHKTSENITQQKTSTDSCTERTPEENSSTNDTPASGAQSKKRMLLPKPPETGVSSSANPVVGLTTPLVQVPMLPSSSSSACKPVPQSVFPSFVSATMGPIILSPPVILTHAKNEINSVNLTLPTFQCISSPSTFISMPTLVPEVQPNLGSSGNQCVSQILTSIPAPLQLIPGNVNCGFAFPSCSVPANVPTVIGLLNSTSEKHLNVNTAAESVLPSIVSSSTISEEKFNEDLGGSTDFS